MKLINNINSLKDTIKQSKGLIGFVPTMGALHDGHMSLIKKAREQNDIVLVSIFINPAQFLHGEDFEHYPTKISEDNNMCKLAGVDILFTPTKDMMYADDEVVVKAPMLSSYMLEGLKRPGHFDGVLQVVLKLFNLIQPTNAYFGKKDAQQLSLIKQMVSDLFLDINIIECEIIRENDGLAMSSRNIYLDANDRKLALNIYKSLKTASNMIKQNHTNCEQIIINMTNALIGLDIEYISIVNQRFRKIEKIIIGDTIILVAIKVGKTRLIDNIWI